MPPIDEVAHCDSRVATPRSDGSAASSEFVAADVPYPVAVCTLEMTELNAVTTAWTRLCSVLASLATVTVAGEVVCALSASVTPGTTPTSWFVGRVIV